MDLNQPSPPPWIRWCTRIQAISQNGLTFAKDPYDIERYSALREIAAEILAASSNLALSSIRDILTADSGYATPKVDVRGVVFRENRILLVQERSDGYWTAPGGWADVGESPAENVVREVFEESGFRTQPVKLLAVFDRSKHPHEPPFAFHVYKIFILCELMGGSPVTSSETSAVDFFGESELPPLSTGRITPWQVKRMFEHHRNPDLATDFDR